LFTEEGVVVVVVVVVGLAVVVMGVVVIVVSKVDGEDSCPIPDVATAAAGVVGGDPLSMPSFASAVVVTSVSISIRDTFWPQFYGLMGGRPNPNLFERK
jgi:hypothetical protein